MTDRPTTEAGRALLDRVSPPVPDNVDPEEDWVGEAWAHRNEIEYAILAIEAEARSALIDELVAAVEKEPNHFVPEATPWRAVEGFRAAVLRILEGARHGK